MERSDDPLMIQQVAKIVKQASSILFITGAGLSAESGLPTYRGVGGLYNDTLTEDGIPIEEALSGAMLFKEPQVTWKYLARLEEQGRDARFNPAHRVMAEMEDHLERVWVLTQNIDGLHQQAGSRKVIEIHGNIHRLFCPACGWKQTIKDFTEIDIPPSCPACEQEVRPDVVFFGEMLPTEEVMTLVTECDRGFDCVFSVGTTSVFPYIRQPVEEARRLGRPTVEINPDQTEISHVVDYKITQGAVLSLQQIWDRVKG